MLFHKEKDFKCLIYTFGTFSQGLVPFLGILAFHVRGHKTRA